MVEEEVVDQSLFSSQQAMFQPPPMSKEKNSKPRKMIFLFSGIFAFILILTITAALLRKQPEQELSGPTPPITTAANESLKQQELRRLKTLIETANPENLLIVPPIVDMEVSLY